VTEHEPLRTRDLLLLVDIVRMAMTAHRTDDGCISPLGIKVIEAALTGLEAKLRK